MMIEIQWSYKLFEQLKNKKFLRGLLFCCDNIILMKEMPNKFVDLIYIDPPFNTNRNYKTKHDYNKAFTDIFRDYSGIEENIDMIYEILNKDNGNAEQWRNWTEMLKKMEKNKKERSFLPYIVYMTIRLVEMKRILKDTGSVYLHCDTTAVHYLKISMDIIFGYENFKNDIIWKRASAHNDATKRYGRVHDNLLFYIKDDQKYFWNKPYKPYSKEYIKRNFKYIDNRGSYSLNKILVSRGRDGYSYEYNGYNPPKDRLWAYSEKGMRDLDRNGLLYFPSNKDGILFKKIYLDSSKGVPLQDIFLDTKLNSKEFRTGYPTQKPIDLIDTIINASCPKDGIVFDPFCGCGTTIYAIEERKRKIEANERKWIGCDIGAIAITTIQKKLEEIYQLTENRKSEENEYYETIIRPHLFNNDDELYNDVMLMYNKDEHEFRCWCIKELLGGIPESNRSSNNIDGRIVINNDTEVILLVRKKNIEKNINDQIFELNNNIFETKREKKEKTILIIVFFCFSKKETNKNIVLNENIREYGYCIIDGETYPKIQYIVLEEILKSISKREQKNKKLKEILKDEITNNIKMPKQHL